MTENYYSQQELFEKQKNQKKLKIPLTDARYSAILHLVVEKKK